MQACALLQKNHWNDCQRPLVVIWFFNVCCKVGNIFIIFILFFSIPFFHWEIKQFQLHFECINALSCVRRKFLCGEVIHWHMVVICIWCAKIVMSQFDVIFGFQNQRFGEVCWRNMHILLHALPIFYVSLHWIKTISAPGEDIGGKQTQCYDTAVHNCKNIGLHVKTWE